MGTEGPARRILARIDADVSRASSRRGRVVLAFSGGLASLVLAAVARKHGDMRCVVVGTRHASDVEAALVARFHLDYPVDVMRPGRARILDAARTVHAAHPRLAPADVLSIVPLVLVEERYPEARVLSGFGLSPRSAALQRYLAAALPRPPGLTRSAARPPPRRLVLRIAEDLGLPDPFALAARRTPAEGSGIGPALRALGHARHSSVARLLDADVPPRDYHGRPPSASVTKSSSFDYQL